MGRCGASFAKEQAHVGSCCGFGSKKTDCVVCGKWVGSSGYPALSCSSCSFGSKKDNCAKCGKWMGSTKIPAVLCSGCGFGSKGSTCAKSK